jgi:hypothetical protein
MARKHYHHPQWEEHRALVFGDTEAPSILSPQFSRACFLTISTVTGALLFDPVLHLHPRLVFVVGVVVVVVVVLVGVDQPRPHRED